LQSEACGAIFSEFNEKKLRGMRIQISKTTKEEWNARGIIIPGGGVVRN